MSLGIRGHLAELEVQSILSKAICPILLYDTRPRLCNVLVGDLRCVFIMHERSPPHLFLYLFYLINKNKKRTNKGSVGWNTGEPKSFYYYYYIIFEYYYFELVHSTFYFFYLTQTRIRVKFAK